MLELSSFLLLKLGKFGFGAYICNKTSNWTLKMILEIRLSNFYSIMNEVVLDMQAANLQTKSAKELEGNTFVCGNERMLKAVAIYGANASGKSNIIKAIRTCVSMIFESHNYNENTIYDFVPFKFGGESLPSRFFIRFLMGGVEYEYSFSMTRQAILQEALYYYPNGRRSMVFTRDESKGGEKKEVYEFKSAIRRPMDVAANTSKKTLFVSRASQMDRPIAKDVFNYFHDHFILNYSGLNAAPLETMLKEQKETLLRVLRIADSDIVDIRCQHDEVLSKPKITTFHRVNPEVPFDFYAEESKGTQILFNMMLTILNIIRANKVLLIDEIETSLHPKLVEYIIGMFHHGEAAQLIFTTHNTCLLDTRKMRKDQIYFVNKLGDGSSDLYSLFDYKDFRESMDLSKAYLQGRFDAIPYIDEASNHCLIND
jgi:AAA15 family ATPase/GTPase